MGSGRDVAVERAPSQAALAWADFSRNRSAMFGLFTIIGFVLLATLGQFLTPWDPHANSGPVLQPPGPDHWMGTDHLARDVFSRFVAGARVTLLVGLSAASIATLTGIVVGGLAGYLGGWVDTILMRFADIVLTIPTLVLGLALAAFLGPSVTNIILIISLLSWPSMARLVRGQFLSIREREYVRASIAVGSSTLWIVLREILPNALPVIFVNWSYGIGAAIITEAALSFLGLGDQQAGSWGILLNDAQRFLHQGWWLSVFPGLGIALTVLSANLVGEGLNDALNPRQRGR